MDKDELSGSSEELRVDGWWVGGVGVRQTAAGGGRGQNRRGEGGGDRGGGGL